MDPDTADSPPPSRFPALMSIADARAAVIAGVTPIARVEFVSLAHARGRRLATPLVSPRALPLFSQSAMDGYALHLVEGQTRYPVHGRIAAGHPPSQQLAPGTAMRIFTGAPVPPGADSVIKQEQATVDGSNIELLTIPRHGDNIRRAGEDVAASEILIPEGAMLDARHIALAAAVGLQSLPVIRRLRIALVSTGDELVSPGDEAGPGQIFDCNRPMLAAALERPSVELTDCGVLPDERALIRDFFAHMARDFDLILTMGGASVGDADHVAGSLIAAGGTVDVAHVAIRPGKPFTFGRLGQASVAILPGNPFAALVAALLFVRPQIERGLGLPSAAFAPLPACADFSYGRPRARTEFVPARIVRHGPDGLPFVQRLGRGGSARLKPLIEADGLAVIAPGETPIRAGDPLGYLPFGSAFAL